MARIPIVCPCGNVPDDVKVSEKEGYEVVRCGWCGIMRTTEREDNYETLYTEGTRYHVEEMDKIGRDHYGDRFDHDFDIAWDKRIPALLGQYRIIDVGCANGAFVSAMQQNGFQAEGIELNPTMAETARAVTGCPIHESWALVSGQFDIVTYHDVFEHVVNPRQELQLIRKYLRPNGLLVLDCPDAAEIFGATARASHHEKPQQHLFYYTIDTLSALLISEGFYIGAVERPIVGKIVLYARKENGTT